MRHVEKGCLSRVRQDIRSDGSRIEGSHKGWNSLMRSYASGLENMQYLGHDFVLRRNIRAATSTPERRKDRPFAASGFGSHHVSLVDSNNRLWNELVDSSLGREANVALDKLPVLVDVDSKETFGVVNSDCATTSNGLIKKEEEDLDLLGMSLHDDDNDDRSAEDLLREMHIDPELAAIPESLPASTPAASAHPPIVSAAPCLRETVNNVVEVIDLSVDTSEKEVVVSIRIPTLPHR